MGGAWGDCNGLRRTSFVTTRLHSVASRSRPLGVKTTSGMSQLVTLANSAASSSQLLQPTTKSPTKRFNGASGAATTPASTSRLASTSSTFRLACLSWVTTVTSTPITLSVPVGSSETWYVKGGIRTRLSALGQRCSTANTCRTKGPGLCAATRAGATDSEPQVWGLGVVQEVDAAAMSVWLKYRNLSYDDNSAAAAPIQDFDYVGRRRDHQLLRSR